MISLNIPAHPRQPVACWRAPWLRGSSAFATLQSVAMAGAGAGSAAVGGAAGGAAAAAALSSVCGAVDSTEASVVGSARAGLAMPAVPAGRPSQRHHAASHVLLTPPGRPSRRQPMLGQRRQGPPA